MKFQVVYRVLFSFNGKAMIRKVPSSLFELYIEKINREGGILVDAHPCDVVEV